MLKLWNIALLEKRNVNRSNQLSRNGKLQTRRAAFETLESRELLDATGFDYPLSSAIAPPSDVPETIVVDTDSFAINPDDGKISLPEAIENANDGATILFDSSLDGKTISINSELNISHSITIDAKNRVTLDAGGNNRIFNISGGSEDLPVILRGLTLQHGYTYYNGGAIYFNGVLKIENSNFVENQARIDGGAIDVRVVAGVQASLTIENSTFTGNTAGTSGGAIADNNGILTIVGSTFDANSSGYSGGAVLNNHANATIADSSFTENSTSQNGGAIYSNGVLAVERTEFIGNSAVNYGGAIQNWDGSATIVNSTFRGNTSEAGYGGAVLNSSYIKDSVGRTTIVQSVFYDNYAPQGGAVANVVNASTNLYHCTIAGNSAGKGGGVYNTDGTLCLYNSIVSLNRAEEADNVYGAINDPTGNCNNCIDADPRFVVAPQFDDDGKLTNADCLNLRLSSGSVGIDAGDGAFVQAEYDFDGKTRVFGKKVDLGAFEFVSIAVDTEKDVVDPNDGLTSLREAIDAANDGTTILFDQRLVGKTICLNEKLDVSKAIAIDGENRVTLDGGDKYQILNIKGGSKTNPVLLRNLKFQNGYAYEGGAVRSNGVLTIENSSFLQNSAKSRGGVLYAEGVLTIKNSEFSKNSANLYYGGAVYSTGDLTIEDSVFADNFAGYDGGAIYKNQGLLTIANSTFTGNTADFDGGAIFAYLGEHSIANSTFDGNSAKYYGGGAIEIQSGRLTLSNSILCNNTAKESGAIEMEFGGLILVNSVLFNNTTEGSGGAVFLEYKDSSALVANCTISGNAAQSGGGWGNAAGGSVTIFNTIVSQNFAVENPNMSGPTFIANNNCIDGEPGFVVAPIFSDAGKLMNADELDLRLDHNSNAIDAGNSASVLTEFDLDGNPRVVGDAVDIGAYEFAWILVDTEADVVDPNDGVTSLREAIELAPGGTTIVFDERLVKTITLDSELTIAKSITIDGEDRVVLDGGKKNRIFKIIGENEDSHAILRNLTLQNGKAKSQNKGGAIYSEGRLTIENSTFIGNSGFVGGAVENNGGNLTIKNSTFSDNHADFGGAVGCEGGCLTIVNSVLTRNSVSSIYGAGNGRGGAIYMQEGVTYLYNCTVAGNTATVRGGGLCVISGSCNACNSIVAQNYAPKDVNINGSIDESSCNNCIDAEPSFIVAPEFSAGALSNADEIDLRLSRDSAAIDQGDCVYVDYDCDLDGKRRVFGAAVDIGAYEAAYIIVNTEKDVVKNDNLTSLREAIALAYDGTTIYFDENLDGKTIDVDAQLVLNHAVTIDGENRATLDGGGLNRIFYVDGGTENAPVLLKNITLQNGYASDGGAIFVDGVLNLDGVSFNVNQAENGGALYAAKGSTVSAVSITARQNQAAKYGGSVYNAGKFTLVQSEGSSLFDSNSAALGGAFYSAAGAELAIEGLSDEPVAFLACQALSDKSGKYGSGGAIYNSASADSYAYLTLNNVEFYLCGADKYGGAISNYGVVQIENGMFVGNKAGSGGALQNAGQAFLYGRNGFLQNEAKASNYGNGGAIYSSNNASSPLKEAALSVAGSNEFAYNTASNAGGAIDVVSGSVCFGDSNVDEGASFVNNSANNIGGAIVLGVPEMTTRLPEGASPKDFFCFDENAADYGAAVAVNIKPTDARGIVEAFGFDYSDLSNDEFAAFMKIASDIKDGVLSFEYLLNLTNQSVETNSIVISCGERSCTLRPGESATFAELGVDTKTDGAYKVKVDYGNGLTCTLMLGTAKEHCLAMRKTLLMGKSDAPCFSFTLYGAAANSWTIDWGDNTTPTSFDKLASTFTASHLYKEAGKYTVVVSAAIDEEEKPLEFSFIYDAKEPNPNDETGGEYADALLDEVWRSEELFDEFWG